MDISTLNPTVFEAAADALMVSGHIKGKNGSAAEGYCMGGAVLAAFQTTEAWRDDILMDPDPVAGVDKHLEALAQHIQDTETVTPMTVAGLLSKSACIPSWNDAKERAAGEVVAKLLSFAKAIREAKDKTT